jgi:hypothetical protein
MNYITFSENEYMELMYLYSVIYTMLEIDEIGHPNMDPNQLSPLYTAVSHMHLDDTYDIEKIGRHIALLNKDNHFDDCENIYVYDSIIDEIIERDGTMIKSNE